MEIQYTTKDGAITMSVKFNNDDKVYELETVREIITVLGDTAASLRFIIEHPELNIETPAGLPS